MPSITSPIEQSVKVDGRARVLIVDPRELMRQCFVQTLTSFCDENVLAVEDIHTYSQTASEGALPDVIIYHVPGGQPIATDFAERLPPIFRGIPLIVMSNDCMPSEVFDLLNNGVRGFVPTSATLEVAIQALRLVLAGGTYVPVSCLHALPEPSTKRDRNSLFTGRQQQVVEALRLGKSNKIIAYELNMCESTVKVHVRAIMKKLKARNRTEAAYIFSTVSASTIN